MSSLHVRALWGQGIETRYLGPTNHRGPRILARCEAKRITIPWDDGLDVRANHEGAARALCDALGWSGEWVGVSTKRGYVFGRY